jgi:hypothetical protein
LQPHEHYEELCAVAVSGQAGQSELDELKHHLSDCPGCRQLLTDFARVGAHAVPEIAEKHAAVRVPDGMKERFLARAYSEGLFLNKEQEPTHPAWFSMGMLARWSAVAVSVVIIAVALRFYTSHRNHPAHQTITSTLDETNQQTDQAPNRDQPDLTEELAASRAYGDAIAKKLAAAQQALESSEERAGGVSARLAELETANVLLRKSQEERDHEAAQLKQEIEQLHSQRDADHIAALVQENDLKELRRKVADQDAELNASHRLTAATDRARDLIVARNLHIVDVHDADENGKGQRAFGRIFYTEGRSLIFYAYDLADARQLNAKISFYVWGEKLGAAQPVKNLGIFHSDDVNDGRWVLTFDDPNVLARINSVFVTVESSKKDITRPSGKKILYAFLGNKANHP